MSKIIRTSLLATLAATSVLALGGDALSPFERTARADDDLVTREIPQLLSFGGPVVAAPHVVPVFFPGDPLAASLTDFLGKVTREPTFASTLREYGVGTASIASSITLDEAPPALITSVEIRAWMGAKIASATLPAPDANTVYVLVYPVETEVDLDFGFGFVFPACFSTATFSDNVTTASGALANYVVAPRCEGFFGLSGVDAVTMPLSAELASAFVTPRGADGFAGIDFNGSGFAAATFAGTIGGFCEFLPDGFGTPPALGYTISRLWSNRAARQQRDPCRGPGQSAHYFNAVPLGLDGTESQPGFASKGISLAEGGQVTLPIRLFGDARGPRTWQLSASTTWNAAGPSDPNGVLSFSFDRATGGDGDVRHLTVKRAPLPPGAQPFPLNFAIQSTAGGETHSWVVAVGQ